MVLKKEVEKALQYAFRTVDVFTSRRFGGNPLAVVLGADTLETAQMQAIAREFNYSETSFVMRPTDPDNTARVRIFTPAVEVPFAGHPNVGTGYVLANFNQAGTRPDRFIFEENAGLVPVVVSWSGDQVEEVWLTAPEPLSLGSQYTAEQAAACLSLDARDVATAWHRPVIASVGLPFLVVEIANRAALGAARPDLAAISRLLPCEGADAIYLYCRETGPADGEVDLTARMFAPWDGVPEDPATGSATGAACALIASLHEGKPAPQRLRVAQGIDMGRPSLLSVEAGGKGERVKIGGACVPVLSGHIEV